MAAADLQENINHFFSYFEAQHRFLCDLPDLLNIPSIIQEYDHNLVRNMRLLQACAHIDALAHVAEQTSETEREHFWRTLQKHSAIQEWALVSLPKFWRALQHPASVGKKAPRNSLECLSKRPEWTPTLTPQLSGLLLPPDVVRGHRIVPASLIDHDGTATLAALAQLDVTVDKVLEDTLQHFTHAAIFYRECRCALVHEARLRAEGFDFSERHQRPYYAPWDANPSEDDAAEDFESMPDDAIACLVIPDPFVLDTLSALVRNLRCKCKSEGIDPYQYFPGA